MLSQTSPDGLYSILVVNLRKSALLAGEVSIRFLYKWHIILITPKAADWALDLGRDLMVLEKIRDDILLCGTQGTKDEMTHLTRV